MRRLIPLALKVEIMRKRMIPTLVRARKHNRHVELSPALLLDPERWLLKRLLVLIKARVQVVHRLFEAIGRHLIALVVQQPDLDAPAAHRETLHRRGLGDGALLGDELHGALDLSYRSAWRILLWHRRVGLLLKLLLKPVRKCWGSDRKFSNEDCRREIRTSGMMTSMRVYLILLVLLWLLYVARVVAFKQALERGSC